MKKNKKQQQKKNKIIVFGTLLEHFFCEDENTWKFINKKI